MMDDMPEVEVHSEVVFCPIENLPIVRSQRVRTLPGFHVLSLCAGKQAVARGYYDAFGQRFPCHDLEYLHPEDRIYVCPEDRKAFLNKMSMQYHRYICHELGERKVERKRLRERVAERQARSLAHAAQLQQQRLQQAAEARQWRREPLRLGTATAPAIAPPATALSDAASLLLVTNDPYLAAPTTAAATAATAAAETADDAYEIEDDPYIVEDTVGSSRRAPPAHSGGAGSSGTAAPPAAVTAPAVARAVVVGDVPARDAVAVEAATGIAAVPPEQDEEEDLYGGDSGAAAPKRLCGASTYATAIDSIFADDFDKDE
eukprot:NODE_11390_length_1290_cov_3.677558.p1 GENE.NODE_11390_length_1290_cov_3.677558~~NODE_11390_length_1290_cov_3.677558.p1  ORF type:complete len:317 (+),score=112.05 NODE_11390_length_1290_cov_3.677558:122-1072(+)